MQRGFFPIFQLFAYIILSFRASFPIRAFAENSSAMLTLDNYTFSSALPESFIIETDNVQMNIIQP